MTDPALLRRRLDCNLLCIDPGWDEVAVAAYVGLSVSMLTPRGHYDRGFRGLARRTLNAPSDRLHRVVELVVATHACLDALRERLTPALPTIVVIERQEYAGSSREAQNKQRGGAGIINARAMEKLHTARGAIAAACVAAGFGRLAYAPASGKKEHRQLMVQQAFRDSPYWGELLGKRGALNPDAADAAALVWSVPVSELLAVGASE